LKLLEEEILENLTDVGVFVKDLRDHMEEIRNKGLTLSNHLDI